jgi:hypothetical protein
MAVLKHIERYPNNNTIEILLESPILHCKKRDIKKLIKYDFVRDNNGWLKAKELHEYLKGDVK